MRFTRRAGVMREKGLAGFTQMLFLFIGIAILFVGIFDYMNPQVFMLGKVSFVFMFIGGMIFVIGTWSFIDMTFKLNKGAAWIIAFFIVCVITLLIASLAMIYEGGGLFG
jgi:hypothetical protein